MLRKALIAVAAVAVMIAVLVLARRDEQSPVVADSRATPVDCLAAMTQAAKAGDVDRYLACFSGKQLELERQQSGADDFSSRLVESVSGLKGQATGEVNTSGDSATLEMTRVFAGYEQQYRVELEQQDSQWKIRQLTYVGQQEQPIPYGTPVVGGQ